MLTTHIDVEIFVDAYKTFMSDPIKNSKDFIDFLYNGTELIVYGIDNLENSSNDAINVLSQLTQGIGEKAKKPRKISASLYLSKTQINKKNPYQVFFINNTDIAEQSKLTNELKMLVGYITNYEETFKTLVKEEFFRVDNSTTINKFKSWSQILPKTFVTNIIISDPYIFESGNDKILLNENYYKLLEALKYNYSELCNVLIFTSNSNKIDRQEIRFKSERILGENIKFGIVLFKPRAESEHDRHIFMNYNHIKVGSSLNFLFDENGSLDVRKKSTIKIESYSSPENYEEALPILEFLNKRLTEYNKSMEVSRFKYNDLLNIF